MKLSDILDRFWWFVFALILLVVGLGLGSNLHVNRVTQEKAVAKFAYLAEVDENQIVIGASTNNWPMVGDPYDVTYEMEIGGQPLTGQCTDGLFQPLVCRLYVTSFKGGGDIPTSTD